MSKDLQATTDEELMKKYQIGSSTAFDLLFERHSGRVFGFLSKRLSKKAEAEDLLQEVFFKLHRSKHLYNSTLPFSPWLFSITRSVLLDFVKKKNFEVADGPNSFDKILPEEVSNIDHDLEGFVSALPQAQKETIALRIFEDKTFEEIASRLATTPENARQLFSRGIRKIRQAMARKKED